MAKDKLTGIRGWILIGAFIALLFWFFWGEAEATELEIGPTFLSAEFADGGIAMITQRVGKWNLSGGYVSKQFINTCGRPDCAFDIKENIVFQAQRVVYKGNWELGIGPAYFQNTNRALGANLNFTLSVGYTWDRWRIRFRHWSNAGSARPNLGQDTILIGFDF